jgi:hypothetical protein
MTELTRVNRVSNRIREQTFASQRTLNYNAALTVDFAIQANSVRTK